MVILKFGRGPIQQPSKRKIGRTSATDRVHARGVFSCGPFSVAYQARYEAGKARTRNEDSLIVSPSTGLFGVFNGMGRHPAGEVASQITASTLVESLCKCPICPERELRRVMNLAHARICSYAANHPEDHGIGSTASVLWLFPDNAERSCIGHVGNSRIYRLRSARLQQLTEDHRLAWGLLKRSVLTTEAMRNSSWKQAISRSEGNKADVSVDVMSLEPIEGDLILICTDGLSDYLTQERISTVMSSFSVDRAANRLMAEVTARGTPDNVSLILLEFHQTGVLAPC